MQTPTQRGARPRSILSADLGARVHPQQVGRSADSPETREFFSRLSPREPSGVAEVLEEVVIAGHLPEFVLFLTCETPRTPRVLPNSGAVVSTVCTWETWVQKTQVTCVKTHSCSMQERRVDPER